MYQIVVVLLLCIIVIAKRYEALQYIWIPYYSVDAVAYGTLLMSRRQKSQSFSELH